MILSSGDIDGIMSVLWAKNFHITPMQSYYKGVYEKAIITHSNIDNDELKSEAIFILKHFDHDYAIVKYTGTNKVSKLFSDGSQKQLNAVLYNTNESNKSYILGGLSFSFIEEKRYWFPKTKDDFTTGMIVEYLNKDKWLKHKVNEPYTEYEKLFKLLIKYNKIRVAVF